MNSLNLEHSDSIIALLYTKLVLYLDRVFPTSEPN